MTTETPQSTDLLHLSTPLPLTSLPAHSSLPAAAGPSAYSLAADLLNQGRSFATDTLNNKLAAKRGLKHAAGSAAQVQVLHGNVDGEYWVARRSRHKGKKEKGDADWDEFDGGLRVEHSKHEMEYTPGVKDCVEVCRWSDVEVQGWETVELAGKLVITPFVQAKGPEAIGILRSFL
jgi:hypothetical protein